MKKLIVCLAFVLGLPAGIALGASPAGATCYTQTWDGSYEENGNFNNQSDCETIVHGVWVDDGDDQNGDGFPDS